jgi:hypothetical protein
MVAVELEKEEQNWSGNLCAEEVGLGNEAHRQTNYPSMTQFHSELSYIVKKCLKGLCYPVGKQVAYFSASLGNQNHVRCF